MIRSIKRLGAFIRLGVSAWALAAAILTFGDPCNAATTIGQIADVEAPLPNQLIGYSLVVGLNGTGDTGDKCPLAPKNRQTLAKLGVQTHYSAPSSTKDIAAVWVSAKVSKFNQGQLVDVIVSGACDATTLNGGRLLPTALIDADGRVEGVAKGSMDPIDANALDARPRSKTPSDEMAQPARGRITGGGLIEQATTGAISAPLHLNLHDADLETAMCVAAAINAVHAGTASADSAKLVTVKPSPSTPLNAFVHDLKQIDFASKGDCARTPAAQAG